MTTSLQNNNDHFVQIYQIYQIYDMISEYILNYKLKLQIMVMNNILKQSINLVRSNSQKANQRQIFLAIQDAEILVPL